jgi:hypothetical protein
VGHPFGLASQRRAMPRIVVDDVLPGALKKRIRAILSRAFAPVDVDIVTCEDDVDHLGQPSIAIRVLLRDSAKGKIESIPRDAFLSVLTQISDLLFEAGDQRVPHVFYVDGSDLETPLAK